MTKKKEGPDQARSWAIATAGCVINSLLSGISRTTGLFYMSLIETYGVSRMEANLPFTMRNIVRNLASPLAGAIGQRYGARDVTFIGGVLACLGITLCSFAPNVTWICVLWGGLHGFGVALGNTLFPVIINQYFLKYRATASGVSLSGACFGSFVLPVVIECLLYNSGLSGAFLISGGLIMNVLPAAILMKEPPWTLRKTDCESRHKKTADIAHPSVARLKNMLKQENTSCEISIINVKRISSSKNLVMDSITEDEDNFQPVTRSGRVFSRNGVDNFAFVGSKMDLTERIDEEVINVDELSYDGKRLRTISIGETSMTVPESPIDDVQETSLTKGILQMLRNPMFHIIGLSLGGFAMLFDPAITVIVDFITDKGLQENDAKYFISMMSLGDLLGRLCFGWVTDKNYMTITKFMLCLQVVQGICFILLPLFSSFEILLTIIMVYGLASGATLVMYPILVSKYLSSVQSLAIGSISVFTGVLSAAVPPLIGYFRDNVGSYDGMFMITGGLSVATGCLWLLEPLLTKDQQKSHRSASVKITPVNITSKTAHNKY